MSVTRFERARIVGARALQISLGAPPLVAVDGSDAIGIATRELEAGCLPMTWARVFHARD